MKLESKAVEEIYAGKVARKYDFSIPPFFAMWKRRAFKESSLKKGDAVLVFCCGTGLDFPHILEKIGKEGKIVGVDFSSEMLAAATEKIHKNHWKNIELIEADITTFEIANFATAKFDTQSLKKRASAKSAQREPGKKKKDSLSQNSGQFDAGVCTLGLSIIPEYKKAFQNLISHVKRGGEIIIGDMQLASGWQARLNPVTIHMARKFGGTEEGHQNSLELYSMIKKQLSDVNKREFFFKAYYYCIGKKK